jgi:hypothetical protein
MIQSFGRARAIRRDTLEKALKAGIFNDVVLDLTVNSVRHWETPNEVVEPLALDGLGHTSGRRSSQQNTPGKKSMRRPALEHQEFFLVLIYY